MLLHVAEEHRRLDSYLASHMVGISRSRLSQAIRGGLVVVNGKAALPSQRLHLGDTVEFEPEPVGLGEGPKAQSIPLDVVFGDEHLAVINKAAGMVVHPAGGHRQGTLVNALLGLGGSWSGLYGPQRPGIVHRLDKETSGLLVVARDEATHLSLAAQLRDRSLGRTYLAVVQGLPQATAIDVDAPIGRHPRDRRRMAVDFAGRPSRTRLEVVERFAGHALMRADLETGRTHQVRVHLCYAGLPIVGDRVYGRAGVDLLGRPALHAWRLHFTHPFTGSRMHFEAALPEDMNVLLQRLRGET